MEAFQYNTFDDEDWVIIDHASSTDNRGNNDNSDKRAESGEKLTFLEALMRNPSQENHKNVHNVRASHSAHWNHRSKRKKATELSAAISLEEKDFTEEYYVGKKNREATRVQGITRLPHSSKEARERRLGAKGKL